VGKNIIIFAIIILVGAVLAASGYLLYQKKLLSKNNMQDQTGSVNDLGRGNNNGKNLPVTNDPGESSIPIDTSQSAIQPGQTEKQQPADQKMTEEQVKQNAEFLNIAKWKPYINDKYGYSFKFPKEYSYGPCDDKNPCKYGQAYEKDGGDVAWVMGNLTNQGWPNIVVTHYDKEEFTLPKDKKLIEWVREKFGIKDVNVLPDYNVELKTQKGKPKKAVKVNISQTPQAYTRDEIYFENSSKIFQIQLMDSNKEPAKKIYDAWLETFVAE
jgi:hypothetical protein